MNATELKQVISKSVLGVVSITLIGPKAAQPTRYAAAVLVLDTDNSGVPAVREANQQFFVFKENQNDEVAYFLSPLSSIKSYLTVKSELALPAYAGKTVDECLALLLSKSVQPDEPHHGDWISVAGFLGLTDTIIVQERLRGLVKSSTIPSELAQAGINGQQFDILKKSLATIDKWLSEGGRGINFNDPTTAKELDKLIMLGLLSQAQAATLKTIGNVKWYKQKGIDVTRELVSLIRA